MEAELRKSGREDVETQTSFPDSELSFEYDADRISLRSVLHRMSSLFQSFHFGGIVTSRPGSRKGSPSPSPSVAVSRQSSYRNKRPSTTFLDVLVPSRRGSIWSLSTMVVSAQVMFVTYFYNRLQLFVWIILNAYCLLCV